MKKIVAFIFLGYKFDLRPYVGPDHESCGLRILVFYTIYIYIYNTTEMIVRMYVLMSELYIFTSTMILVGLISQTLAKTILYFHHPIIKNIMHLWTIMLVVRFYSTFLLFFHLFRSIRRTDIRFRVPGSTKRSRHRIGT